MIYKGTIKDIDENFNATIIANVGNVDKFIKHKPKECLIEFVDSRQLSDLQRRTVYAFIKAIADWSGESPDSAKNHLKLDFISNNLESIADKIFSLKNAPMSVIADFEKYLINFIIENDVPLKFEIYKFVQDDCMEHYIYCCIIHKKCAVCGRMAELHHKDRVGMGRNRDEIIHEGMEAMSLCAKHHIECHTIGQKEFDEKYHFDKGVILDKTLCKIYKLKEKK